MSKSQKQKEKQKKIWLGILTWVTILVIMAAMVGLVPIIMKLGDLSNKSIMVGAIVGDIIFIISLSVWLFITLKDYKETP